MIKSNPFTSRTFLSFWSKHFLANKEVQAFPFTKDIVFYKSKFPGLYINAGKNLTKGITYDYHSKFGNAEKGKTFLIYDIIDSPENENFEKTKGMGRYTVIQYPGFLIELEPFGSLDGFMQSTFKKSSRYKLKKYRKKLETCFDINYKMFRGDIEKKEYDRIFDYFRKLLVKRFDEKQTTNNNLETQEWDFYQEVAYPMILENKAGLFVIYNRTQPIAVTLNYFSENVLFDAITVFDIDYSKFHLGSITIMGLIEWSIENNLKVFDFSKGYFDYKKRWATKKYDFEYHVLYDSKSLWAKTLAFAIKSFFGLKQYLRDKKVHEMLHKVTYRLREDQNASSKNKAYDILNLEDDYPIKELLEVDWKTTENDFLKTPIFEFLYLNNETDNHLTVHRRKELPNQYYLFGENKKSLLKLHI